MKKNKKSNLFKYETEKAIVRFVVYFIGILLILCIYYNYIILKYYFYSLFWAFIVSIPLHHVKVKLLEFIKRRIVKKKKNIKINSKKKIDDVMKKNSHSNDLKKKKNEYINELNENGKLYTTNNMNITRNDVKCTIRRKDSFHKIKKNIKKEIDIYTYIFFLLIKPIYKQNKRSNTSISNDSKDKNMCNHINNNNVNKSNDNLSYKNKNASDIYFLILHRIIFFYILKGIIDKYKELLLPIIFCIFLLYIFFKIIKIIWFKYFYKIFRKYYNEYSIYFSFDFSFIYKYYMNDILTIIIIIFSIIIFSSIFVFFLFNIYDESLFIINSINQFLSLNIKNANIIKNFKKFYTNKSNDNIENLYELINLTNIPFLNNKTISFIYNHLKRSFDFYQNIYSYNSVKKKKRYLNVCCVSLIIQNLLLIKKKENLSELREYILYIKYDKRNELKKIGKYCKQKCYNYEHEKEENNLFDLNFFFYNVLNNLNFKQMIHLFPNNDSLKKKNIIEQFYLKKNKFQNEINNNLKKYYGLNNCDKNTSEKEKKNYMNYNKKDLNIKPYEDKMKEEKHFKFKETINYIYNLILSFKKIENIGKLTKFILFNNGYGLIKIIVFILLVCFNFFIFTFDAIVRAIIFFTALYYLISSKKSVLNYLKDILLVVDPSSFFFNNITNNLKAIIKCIMKRLYFYTLYIWFIFSFFKFPIIYVPTLLCIILSLIPVISPEIIILLIVLHLWIIKKQKIISVTLFIINFIIYTYFTTTIFKEIPHTHAWLVSLSLFLSINTFGLKGLILGPLIGSIPLILHQIAIHRNKSFQNKIKKNEDFKNYKKKKKKKNYLLKNKFYDLYKFIEINNDTLLRKKKNILI